MENKEIETYPGFLRGYRSWGLQYISNEWRLSSVYTQIPQWRTRVQQAMCLSDQHEDAEAPALHCACGIYARYYSFYNPQLTLRQIHLVGSVKATGRIILSEIGFRAANVEVEALAPAPHGAFDIDVRLDLKRRLASRLQVPFFDSFQELHDAFPPSPVETMAEGIASAPKSYMMASTYIPTLPRKPVTITWHAAGGLVYDVAGEIFHMDTVRSIIVDNWQIQPSGQVTNLSGDFTMQQALMKVDPTTVARFFEQWHGSR